MQVDILPIIQQIISSPPTLITFVPLISSLVVYLLGKATPKAAKYVTLLVVLSLFAYSVLIASWFDPLTTGYQFFYEYNWVPDFNIQYTVGIDGISLPLILIGTFLLLIATLGSWHHIEHQIPLYYALLLVFEAGILGFMLNKYI